LGVSYKPRDSLERKNNNLIIIDLLQDKPVRLISIYRFHNPQDNINLRTKLQTQLKIITDFVVHNSIILGEFNLDGVIRLNNDNP
jgi:hypothetical protein